MTNDTPNDPERIEIIHAIATGAITRATGGKLGQEIGDYREHLTLDLVRGAMSDLPWALRARRATTEEDTQGKDIVVETDRGELYVQVKSSAAGVADWRKKHSALLGPRAFVVLWTNDKGPSKGFIVQELQRAYASAKRDGQTTETLEQTPPAVRATLNTLPEGFRCLFDATGKLLSTVSQAYLKRLEGVYALALERDREKTKRVEETAGRERTALRQALRKAVYALRTAGDSATLAEIEEAWPESRIWLTRES